MMKTTHRAIAVLAAAGLSLTCVPAMASAAEAAPKALVAASQPGQAGPLTAAEVGPLAETLISQGRPATASSLEDSTFPASNAVDGSTTTRWASQEGVDPQWIQVDLGAGATVSRVLLNWEAAYATKYKVQISDDGVTWTTLKDETAGNGGTDDITGLSGTGRYLRVHGTARGTSYGYSLYELQVFGTAGTPGGGDGGGSGDETVVTSLSALQSAINSSDPGETIVLKNGTYNMSSSVSLGSSASGTSSAPVVIKAETVGGVTLTGSSSFSFSGVHDVSIQGFRFTQSAETRVDAASKAVDFIRNEFAVSDSVEHTLIINSDDSEIANNWFHDKTTIGVFLAIEGSGTQVAKNLHIHHNYFSDHNFPGSNGGESIRLATSPKALSSGNALVEYNLFENANGDPEAISVKSSGHTIRYNTIRNSFGGIVLRHGNNNKVIGNYILNGHNGIRIYGNDHVIMNNYVAGLTAQSSPKADGAGITVGSGTLRDHYEGEPSTSRTKYDAPDRIRIGLNTLVNNATGIIGETHRTVVPQKGTIVDNVIQGSTGVLADVPLMKDFYWRGNIIWGSASNGNIPTVGYTKVNPQLAQDSAGIWKIGSSSPAVNKAFMTDHGTWVSDDIEGRQRAGVYDVGAHEVTSNAATRAPLTTAKVGPTAP